MNFWSRKESSSDMYALSITLLCQQFCSTATQFGLFLVISSMVADFDIPDIAAPSMFFWPLLESVSLDLTVQNEVDKFFIVESKSFQMSFGVNHLI